MWQSTKDWAYRHRHKLGGSAVVIAGVGAYMYFVPSARPAGFGTGEREGVRVTANGATSSNRNRNGNRNEEDEWASQQGYEEGGGLSSEKSAHRTKMLLRVRKEYSTQALEFLPLLQTRILEAVDFDHAYDQLRELKHLRAANKDAVFDIDDLWEQIKVSSFTFMFVTAYMGSMLCCLLQVQLHIQARGLHNLSGESEEKSTNTKNDLLTDSYFDKMDGVEMGELTSATYTNIYCKGLRQVTKLVRTATEKEMADWPVCDTSFDVNLRSVVEKLSCLRKSIEDDFPALLKAMALVPESTDTDGIGSSTDADKKEKDNNSSVLKEKEKEKEEAPEQLREMGGAPEEAAAPTTGSAGGGCGNSTSSSASVGNKADNDSNSNSAAVNELLAQTWDILESPHFAQAFKEAVGTCFMHISHKLRDQAFSPGSNGEPNDSMALASLLPRIKAMTKEMLAKTNSSNSSTNSAASNGNGNGSGSSGKLTSEVRNIASGQMLGTLCVAIFDAPDPKSL